MKNITISKNLSEKVPRLELSCIECDVIVETKNENLWKRIKREVKKLNSTIHIGQISKLQAVAAARKAYKACGKDPARYRLSAEALLRRVVKGNGLYQINNVVDLLNLVSISTGYSIGGYDAREINGDIIFDIGKKDEPYTGIGRGELNIEFLPVFRDSKGAFGTSTSDSPRTGVTENTKRFLMIIVDYEANGNLDEATKMAEQLLAEFAGGTQFEMVKIKP